MGKSLIHKIWCQRNWIDDAIEFNAKVLRATDTICASPILWGRSSGKKKQKLSYGERVKRFALRAIRVKRWEETHDSTEVSWGKDEREKRWVFSLERKKTSYSSGVNDEWGSWLQGGQTHCIECGVVMWTGRGRTCRHLLRKDMGDFREIKDELNCSWFSARSYTSWPSTEQSCPAGLTPKTLIHHQPTRNYLT